MKNLFWPVYKNLEKEVIELSYYIHFSDDNLDVYSIKIAELLLRCSIEIEAISKALYTNSGGPKSRNLYFDYDCIKYFIQNWALDKKIVYLNHDNFFFINHEINNPLPFVNADKKNGCEWKMAYQAVKHNRTGGIKKGNLRNLISAVSALFILNLYYKYDSTSIKRGVNKDFINLDLGTEMFFLPQYTFASYVEPEGYSILPNIDEYIFIQRHYENDFSILNEIENKIYSDHGYKRVIKDGYQEIINTNPSSNAHNIFPFIRKKIDHAIQDFYLEIFTNKKKYF